MSPPAPKQRIGSEGTGNGQFKEPQALAVSNSSGAAWVLDSGDSRIEKFSIEGTFQAAYGSAGTGHVQFSDPQGIAVNQNTGNVYVADTNNNRVEELNSEGKYVSEFCAKEVEEKGTKVEACNKPTGIAIDASGHVWIANHGDNHVDEFTETGQFIQQLGVKGAGNGQFEGPSRSRSPKACSTWSTRATSGWRSSPPRRKRKRSMSGSLEARQRTGSVQEAVGYCGRASDRRSVRL